MGFREISSFSGGNREKISPGIVLGGPGEYCFSARLHAWGFRSRFRVFPEGKKSGFPVFRDVSAPARRGQELRISGFWNVVSKRSVPDFRENEGKYDV